MDVAKKKFKIKNFRLFLIVFFIAVLALISFFSSPLSLDTKKTYPEIQAINFSKMNFQQLRSFFKDLSIGKGALYAFEVLNLAPLPPATDVHLIGHAIGDVLYQQKGVEGMAYCSDNFRNACSHSIVIDLLQDKGEEALSSLTQTCEKAPGTANAYNNCFHGVGHGILAFTGYNLPRTIELCKKTATQKHRGSEYKECVGGAIMEQISGGDHDKKTWQKQRLVNLGTTDNPLFPCMSSLIPDTGARNQCLIFLTPYLWQLSGRTGLIPSDETVNNSFKFCDLIPADATGNRGACFFGFGKEFVALAKDKDERMARDLTNEEMRKIYRWCLLTSDPEGQKMCIISAQIHIYWSGSVDKKVIERFCRQAPNDTIMDYCYSGLIDTIKRGEKNIFYNLDFCTEMPLKLFPKCVSSFIKII